MGKVIHFDNVPVGIEHVGYHKWRFVTPTKVSIQLYHSQEEAWWAYTLNDVEWRAK